MWNNLIANTQRFIGQDCENIIYEYKEQLEFADHKKKFKQCIININDFKGIVNYAINGITIWCTCGDPFKKCKKRCLFER